MKILICEILHKKIYENIRNEAHIQNGRKSKNKQKKIKQTQ